MPANLPVIQSCQTIIYHTHESTKSESLLCQVTVTQLPELHGNYFCNLYSPFPVQCEQSASPGGQGLSDNLQTLYLLRSKAARQSKMKQYITSHYHGWTTTEIKWSCLVTHAAGCTAPALSWRRN